MSEWHAIEALNEGIERTMGLLFKPFNLRLWLKIALVVFLTEFLSGSMGEFTRLGNLGDSDINFTGELVILIIVALAVILFISLVLQFISSVFSFVFIEALFENRIEFVEGFKRNINKGLSLFIFNFVVGFISLVFVLGLVLLGVFLGIKVNSLVFSIMLIVLGAMFFIIYLLVLILVFSITNDFIVPLMHFKGLGIMNSWAKTLGLIETKLSQFLVYFVLKIAFGMIAGIIEFFVGMCIFFVLLIIAIVLGGGSVLAWLGLTALIPGLSQLTIFMLLLAVVVIIIVSLIVSYIMVALTLPIPVFFRYYSILFIQRIYPEIRGTEVVLEKPPEKADESGKKKVKSIKKKITIKKGDKSIGEIKAY